MIATLDKMKKQFWSTVIVGDEKIDTDLMENIYQRLRRNNLSRISERFWFDQTQSHKGLPRSNDEILGRKSEIPTLPA
jgi:hypothetical protein